MVSSACTINIICTAAVPRNVELVKRLRLLGFSDIHLGGIAFPRDSPQSRDALVDARRFSKMFKRTMLDGEIGCYLSHLRAYDHFLAGSDQWLVLLEDDVTIEDGLRSAIDATCGMDSTAPIIVSLGALEMNTSAHERRTPPLLREPMASVDGVAVHQALFGGWSSLAYAINRQAATMLRDGYLSGRMSSPIDWPPASSPVTFAQVVPVVAREMSGVTSVIDRDNQRLAPWQDRWSRRRMVLQQMVSGYLLYRHQFDSFRGYIRWTYGLARPLMKLPWTRHAGTVQLSDGVQMHFLSPAQVRWRFSWIGLGPPRAQVQHRRATHKAS